MDNGNLGRIFRCERSTEFFRWRGYPLRLAIGRLSRCAVGWIVFFDECDHRLEHQQARGGCRQPMILAVERDELDRLARFLKRGFHLFALRDHDHRVALVMDEKNGRIGLRRVHRERR